MQRILAVIAFMCFCLSTFIHLGTYLGFNAGEAFPLVWGLHLITIFFLFSVSRKPKEQSWKTYLQDIPEWGQRLLKIFFFYACINFALFFTGEVGKGTPQRLNSTFALYRIDNGQRFFVQLVEASEDLETIELLNTPVLREVEGGISVFGELTEAEYYQRTIPIVRGFTGHWMIGLLLPSLYFWYKKPESAQDSNLGPQETEIN